MNRDISFFGAAAQPNAGQARSPHRNELTQFIDALNNGTALPTRVRDGLYALHLADCALESVKSGRSVTVDYDL